MKSFSDEERAQQFASATGGIAYPQQATFGDHHVFALGLTKRELFAVHMMAAYRMNERFANYERETMAAFSVKDADALLAELAK